MPDLDEGAQSSAEDDAGSAGSTQDTGESGSTGAQGGTRTTADADVETVSRKDYEAIRSRMQAADRRASERERELQEIRNKDLPEVDKLKREHAELTAKAETLAATNRKLSLENAFFQDNKYEWQDPRAALKLVDLSDVEIADDGTVTGLQDALKRLASSYAWMLKDKKAEAEPPATGAGTPPMNGRGSTDKPDKNKQTVRFPALRNRTR